MVSLSILYKRWEKLMYTNICKHCKKVFKSRLRQFTCQECMRKDQEIFEKIEAYLKEYPNSNALQIAEGLTIDVYEVLKFMDEGRLMISKGRFERF